MNLLLLFLIGVLITYVIIKLTIKIIKVAIGAKK